MTIKSESHEHLIPAAKVGKVRTLQLPAFDEALHRVEREEDDHEKSSGFRIPTQHSNQHPEEPEPETPASDKEISLPDGESLALLRAQAIEEGHAEGRAEGYREGFDLGKQEGFREGEALGLQQAEDEATRRFAEQLAKEGEMLREMSRQLVFPIADQDEAITHMLADMSLSIARQIVLRELQTDSSQIEKVCRDAVLSLPVATGRIRIHLNPADLPMVQQLCLGLQGDWQLIPEQQMLPGGCRIESEASLIDASVEKRFDLIAAQLAEQHLHTHAQTAHQQQQALDAIEAEHAADSTIGNGQSIDAEQLSSSDREIEESVDEPQKKETNTSSDEDPSL